MKQILLFIKSY